MLKLAVFLVVLWAVPSGHAKPKRSSEPSSAACSKHLHSGATERQLAKAIGAKHWDSLSSSRREEVMRQVFYLPRKQRVPAVNKGRALLRNSFPPGEFAEAWFKKALTFAEFSPTEAELRWLGEMRFKKCISAVVSLEQVAWIFDVFDQAAASPVLRFELSRFTVVRFGLPGLNLVRQRDPAALAQSSLYRGLFDPGVHLRPREVEPILSWIMTLPSAQRVELYEQALNQHRFLGAISSLILRHESLSVRESFFGRMELSDLLRSEERILSSFSDFVWLKKVEALDPDSKTDRNLALNLLMVIGSRLPNEGRLRLTRQILKVLSVNEVPEHVFRGLNLEDRDLIDLLVPPPVNPPSVVRYARFVEAIGVVRRLFPEQAARLRLVEFPGLGLSRDSNAPPTIVRADLDRQLSHFQKAHPAALSPAELAWASPAHLSSAQVLRRLTVLVRQRPGLDQLWHGAPVSGPLHPVTTRAEFAKELRDFFKALASNFGSLEESERRDLRREQGIRQVEELNLNIQNQIRSINTLASVEPALERSFLLRMVNAIRVMNQESTQRMRGQAVALLENFLLAGDLYARFLPMRVQIHNLPDAPLLAEYKELLGDIEVKEAEQLLRAGTHRFALDLLNHIETFLSTVRIESSGYASGKSASLADIEALASEPVDIETVAKFESRLMYYLVKHDYDPHADLTARRRWARVLLKIAVKTGWLEPSEGRALALHGLDRADDRAVADLLVAFEDRLFEKLRSVVNTTTFFGAKFFEQRVRESFLLGVARVVQAYGGETITTLRVDDATYPVSIVSEGKICGRLDDLEWWAEEGDDAPLPSALILESRLPSAHHVVMRMRALQRPVLVVRSGVGEFRDWVRRRGDSPFCLSVRSGVALLTLDSADAAIGKADRARFEIPAETPGPAGPKARHLEWLASNPALRSFIAPRVPLPDAIRNSSTRAMSVASGLGDISRKLPGEKFVHVRSDFEVEDGERWNAAGMFQSIPFVGITPDSAEAVTAAIDQVITSWRNAPLKEIYGQHPADVGHGPKILLSASRGAQFSGVMIIDADRTVVELRRGTGAVVEDARAAETWHILPGNMSILIALADDELKPILNRKARQVLLELLPALREHLPAAGARWEVEFGFDAATHPWIHQARKAF